MLYVHRQLTSNGPGIVLGAIAIIMCALSSGMAFAATDGGGTLQQVSLVMNWFPQAEQGGYYEAKAEKLGQASGITIHIIDGGPQSQTIAQVAAGRADFGVAQADELLLARANGAPLVEVSAAFKTSPQCMMFHPGTGIHTLADLDGHTISVAPSGGYWPWMKGHFNYRNIKVVSIGSIAQFKHDHNLVKQCFITNEPYYAKQAHIPYKAILIAAAGYNPYNNGLFTTEKMIREHPKLVRKTMAAVVKGWQDYMTHPAPGNNLIRKRNKNVDPGLLAYAHSVMKKRNLMDKSGRMKLSRFQKLKKQLTKARVLKNDIDVSKVFTNKFLPQQ